jgi:iron complex transport system ATP-binding protein
MQSHSTQPSSQIQVTDLTVSVARQVLISNLNWQINAGDCWCIIGRNGAGKSTLMRTLAGLLPVVHGTVAINGRSLPSWPLMDLARLRAYLPQGRNDAFGYRAIDTVLAARHPYHDGGYWESEQDIDLAHAALAELDVDHLAHRDVRSLSGGERQRVALAALIVQYAQCILLDEPTTALDLPHQVNVMELIARRCKSHHNAVIMVSHDLNLAFRYATHALLLMPDGAWQAGPVRETMTRDSLSKCLEHPIDAVWHGEQCLFVPH